jgi:8-oxo-dGTP diphosphatase
MAGESLNHPRVGVGVFVFRDGKFLMGKRRGSHGTGTWSVPGGWLEYRESLEDASKREIKEETGIEITNVTFGALTNNIFKDEDIHSLTAWMVSDWQSGEPTILEPDKFTDQGWFDFNHLPEPLFMPWDELLSSDSINRLRKISEDKSA